MDDLEHGVRELIIVIEPGDFQASGEIHMGNIMYKLTLAAAAGGIDMNRYDLGEPRFEAVGLLGLDGLEMHVPLNPRAEPKPPLLSVVNE